MSGEEGGEQDTSVFVNEEKRFPLGTLYRGRSGKSFLD